MAIPDQIATSILVLLLSFFSTDVNVVADDSVAMAKLASAFKPPPPSWSTNVSSSYCEWNYVLCDRLKRVTSINIQFHTMKGHLAHEIAGLSQLQVLSIKNNRLSGTIPLLNNLTCLTELSLDVNEFTDIAPGFFQGLPATIQVLAISYNPIAPWTMPLQLPRLSNLTVLKLDDTNLLGPIPNIFQSLPLLRTLSLSNNNLTGPLPPSLCTCKLEGLFLDNQDNGLSGTIDVLSNITTLVYVNIDDNQFSGSIPDFSRHKSLDSLSLDNNQLTGIIPPSFSSLSLSFFKLFNNKLLGPFPKFLLDDPYQAQGNNFCTQTGEPCDDQVTILLEIAGALGYPSLLVESWIGNDACASWKFVICNFMKQIIEINFGDQRFGGTISSAFANLKALQSIYLHNNNLQGPIPESLMKLIHLQVLDISGNNLSGNIPAFSKSVKLNVSGNTLLRYPSTKILRPHGDTRTQNGKSKGRRKEKIVIVIISSVGTMLGALCVFLLGKQVSRHPGKEKFGISNQEKANSKINAVNIVVENGNQIDFEGIKMFNYEHLALATSNFASANKLGQGGFGPVFMGKLENGIEIAVKRLAGASGQGPEEFMNEVIVISKLQHRNLITLLGCCIEREENMLVYEYMPNKSLDNFLFDPDKRKLLDWQKCFSIIQGISQGLQYLHKDSKLRIVHRDLKASNILLDTDLNPKISDFGIAKVFTGTKDQGNTRRVMGTYGYMSPEYVLEGRFSQKSDVFSFGILVLEIVSGIRNGGLDSDNHSASLLEHAWGLWNEGNILSLIDPVIFDMSFHKQMLRCIHVGLLCVQDLVSDRPTMSEVISMLKDENHEIIRLPAPKQPIFIEWKMAADHYSERGFSSAITFSVTSGR